MPLLFSRRSRPLLFRPLGLALALASGLAAVATDARGAERPTVELDLEALLTSPRVTATTLDDPVWSIELEAGAELFQVPVRVIPGTETGVLDRPSAGLANGRFLGWWVPEPGQPEGEFRPPADDASAEPPRIARELAVRPDGGISWEIDRLGRDFTASSSGFGSSASLYALKLDSQLLRDLRPETPPRAPRGTDLATVRATADAFRAERDAYAELRDAVSALPDRAQAEGVSQVWLIYERRRPETTLVFESGSNDWAVDPEAFGALRSMAGSGFSGLGSTDLGRVLPPDRLVTATQPLGAEAIALAAGRAVARDAQRQGQADAASSAALALAEAVARRGPEPAARRLIAELAVALPPTPTTVALIAAAAPRAGDFGRVASLRSRLLGLAEAVGGVASLDTTRAVAELQGLLAEPEGPPITDLINALADAAGQQPDLAEAAATVLRPGALPEHRLAALVDAVIRRAARDAVAAPNDFGGDFFGARSAPVAGVLLDRTLLRSFDPAVVEATLSALEASAGNASAVLPALAALRGLITGPGGTKPDPAALALGTAASAAGDADAPTPAPTPDPPRLAGGSLLLQPADHGLLQQLRSGDPGTRARAASVLRLFRLPTGPEGDATLTALLAATGENAPSGLVTLLRRSPDTTAVNAALLRLLARAEGAARQRVLLGLSGSGRSLAQPLSSLEPAEQVAVAAAVLGPADDAPDAAGLVLDFSAANFLAERLSAGRPVRAAQLAAAIGDESQLLNQAADPDPLKARGAMAGLAATAGAGATGQIAAIAAMTEAGSPPAEAWPAVRDGLRLARLSRAAGSYRLVVSTGPAAGPSGPSGSSSSAASPAPAPLSTLPGLGAGPGASGGPENDATRPRRIELGVVVLRVTDQGLSMDGDPLRLKLAPDTAAIRIDDPGELANFPGDEILAVPLAAAVGPLDLEEVPSGWRGSSPLGAGGQLTVELLRNAPTPAAGNGG